MLNRDSEPMSAEAFLACRTAGARDVSDGLLVTARAPLVRDGVPAGATG